MLPPPDTLLNPRKERPFYAMLCDVMEPLETSVRKTHLNPRIFEAAA